jgi:hypothetical protein
MTREELSQIVLSHYDSLVGLNVHTNFHDYEASFLEIHRKIGQEILEKNIGDLPSNKRKKNATNDHRKH